MKEYTYEEWKKTWFDKVVEGYYDVQEEDKLKIGVTSGNN